MVEGRGGYDVKMQCTHQMHSDQHVRCFLNVHLIRRCILIVYYLMCAEHFVIYNYLAALQHV